MLKQNLIDQIAKTTSASGIYKFIGEENEILYIGKAKNLRKRLNNYVKPDKLSSRIRQMTFLAQKIETNETNSDLEAILLEHNLIKKHRPKFNILLKDDKSFAAIAIDKTHPFGAIYKYRGAKKTTQHQFGPFASAFDVNRVIDILRKTFLLRNCSDAEFSRRKKPCLEYQIKKCSAPCVGLISESDYQKSIQNSVDFLSSKSNKIQQNLAQKMQNLSQNLEFEKAAQIRDKIKSLSAIQTSQSINSNQIDDADIFILLKKQNHAIIQVSFYRGGKNFGSKPYFFNENEDSLLNDFLGQFYQKHPNPKLILTNTEIPEKQLMEEFLSELSGQKTQIKTPKIGEKLEIISSLGKIAEKSLDAKIAKTLSDKKLLLELKTAFNLEKTPQRIEIYDNSHTSTQNAVGAMVVATPDGFDKSQYRKFNIKFEEQNRDDTQMLKEVLKRRFRGFFKEKIQSSTRVLKIKNPDSSDHQKIAPDLVIIDGGLPQLSAANSILNQLTIKIPLILMAKGEHRNAGTETYFTADKSTVEITPKTPLAFYLQNLRDEAHRFAITTHRAKRAKTMTKSTLDQIQNIGAKRKKMLLNHFGSLEKIKEASVKDLCKIAGINKKTAEQIWQELH